MRRISVPARRVSSGIGATADSHLTPDADPALRPDYAGAMRRARREIPLAYDDDFRNAVVFAVLALPLIAVAFFDIGDGFDRVRFIALICLATVLSSLAYLVWTHLLFARTPHDVARRIAAAQHRKRRSPLTRWLVTGQSNDAGGMSLSAAALTLIIAVTAILVGVRNGGLLLPFLVLATAASSWATMLYSFALRYFRLHAGGERFDFDIEEEPVFGDFLAMSTMVSSIGAMSAGTPRTRAGLSAVRTHTWIAFLFNALVVAMTVSILGGMVAAMSEG